MSKTISFKSLQESGKETEFLASDFAKFNSPTTLHVAFKALHKYRKACGGRFPRPWNQEDAEKILHLCKSMGENVSDNLILTSAKICLGNTCPMDAAMGQEDLKACSGKFTPIYQWFYYDAIEYLPENGIEEADAQLVGSRYDAQVTIFARKFQEELGDVKYFVVGAGAIGCELIKNFAMIGAGICNGQIFITDMDLIKHKPLQQP